MCPAVGFGRDVYQEVREGEGVTGIYPLRVSSGLLIV
jgi:hypothetical protein